MAKGILKFNLPEEQEEFDRASHAIDYYLALHEFSQEVLRRMTKRDCHPGISGRELTSEESALAKEISDLFYEILNERNIKLF